MNLSPVIISLKTASASIIITFFLGLICAWAVDSLRSERIKSALDGILTLPMVLPPTVAGFFLLYIFGARRPIGGFLEQSFGVKVAFTWGATVLASAVISFPLMYRSVRGALQQVDFEIISAARTLGLSEWKIFWRIRFPLALPGVVSGGILSFARGLGEFGATAMIAGNIAGKTRTLPLAVYSATASGDMDTAFLYAAIIMAMSFSAVAAAGYFSSLRHGEKAAASSSAALPYNM